MIVVPYWSIVIFTILTKQELNVKPFCVEKLLWKGISGRLIINKNILALKRITFLYIVVFRFLSYGQEQDEVKKIKISKDESVWAGILSDGYQMPLSTGYNEISIPTINLTSTNP